MAPLLLPLELAKENLVSQCLHILTNIYWHMDMAATRKVISTPNILGAKIGPQWRSRWAEVIMDARNDGVVPRVATNNNRNILLKSIDSTSVPPKFN